MQLLYLIYVANVIVAGSVGVISLFSPDRATHSVFSGIGGDPAIIRLVGSLWLSIAVVSLLGLIYPLQASPVLAIQLIYKACWLCFAYAPNRIGKHTPKLPHGMAAFFLVWVLLIPLIFPYSYFISTID